MPSRHHCPMNDRSGSTTIEFAILAPIYLSIILSIFEISVNTYYQGLVDKAADGAGRLVMTGKIAKENLTKNEFQQRACEQGKTGPNSGLECSKLVVSVKRVGSSFYNHVHHWIVGGALVRRPQFAGELGVPVKYCPGEASEIVLVQITYPTVKFSPLPGTSAIFGDLLKSTAVVRNEPFASALPTGAAC
jgi:Flp pilus assembly protein TadG